jgi:hypothetical protein
MNAQALEDLKGWPTSLISLVIFRKIFPIEERLKLKLGAGHVRENDLSMDKNYFNGKWES